MIDREITQGMSKCDGDKYKRSHQSQNTNKNAAEVFHENLSAIASLS
jgi:hypothetical protein